MPVKDHPYAVRLERLERKMVLEPLGVREAEHTAGIPMTGYDRQTAIAVALPGVIGHPCGSIRRLSRFPPPIADDVSTPIRQSKIRNTIRGAIIIRLE